MAKKSAGSQALSEFKAELNKLSKFIREAVKVNESYTYEQVQSFYGDLLERFREHLIEIRADVDKWYEKAANRVQEEFDNLTDEFEFFYQEEEEQQDPNVYYEDDGSFPFPIVSEDECVDTFEGRARNNIILSVSEAIEYLEPVPDSVFVGFIPVFDEFGNIVGFRACIKEDS